MDRGAWWATVHGCKELDTTEQLTLTALKEKIACRFSLSLLGHHFLACSGVWQYHFLFSFLQKCRDLRKLLSLTLINKFMFIMRLVFPVGSCITDFFFFIELSKTQPYSFLSKTNHIISSHELLCNEFFCSKTVYTQYSGSICL